MLHARLGFLRVLLLNIFRKCWAKVVHILEQKKSEIFDSKHKSDRCGLCQGMGCGVNIPCTAAARISGSRSIRKPRSHESTYWSRDYTLKRINAIEDRSEVPLVDRRGCNDLRGYRGYRIIVVTS